MPPPPDDDPPPPFDAGEPLKPTPFEAAVAAARAKPKPLPEGVKPAGEVFNGFAEMLKSTPEEDAAHERWLVERKAQIRAAAQKKAAKEWTEACPPRLQDTDWAHPALAPYQGPIRRALAWKMGWNGLYMVGRSGRGKSRVLWTLARRMAVEAEELVPIVYLTQGQIISDINRTGLDAWLEKMDMLKRAQLIAWDDFGQFAAITSRKEVLATELFDLVDYRYHHRLPMLISSNAREGDLADIFGAMRAEPLFRRIQEGCTIVDFDK